MTKQEKLEKAAKEEAAKILKDNEEVSEDVITDGKNTGTPVGNVIANAISDDEYQANPDLYVISGGTIYKRAAAHVKPEVKRLELFAGFKVVTGKTVDAERGAPTLLICTTAYDAHGRNLLDGGVDSILSGSELMFKYYKIPTDLAKFISDIEDGVKKTANISIKLRYTIADKTTFLTPDGEIAYHRVTGWYADNIFNLISEEEFNFATKSIDRAMEIKSKTAERSDSAYQLASKIFANPSAYSPEQRSMATSILSAR